MNTLLVPIDFSETAANSARYAAELATYLGASKLVLFNAYSMPLATEMSWALLQTEELQKASEEGLSAAAAALAAHCGHGIVIETVSEFGFVADRTADAAANCQADLIVMGITGGGKVAEVVLGSNTTQVIEHTTVPVLIVPADARFAPIRKLGWACDYKAILATTPANLIKKMVRRLSAELVVVYNDANDQSFDPEAFEHNVAIAELFAKEEASFVRVHHQNFADGMDAFIAEHAIDMMLIVPKKHSWISSLFHRSHTTRLAFHTHVPLLCIRALDGEQELVEMYAQLHEVFIANDTIANELRDCKWKSEEFRVYSYGLKNSIIDLQNLKYVRDI